MSRPQSPDGKSGSKAEKRKGGLVEIVRAKRLQGRGNLVHGLRQNRMTTVKGRGETEFVVTERVVGPKRSKSKIVKAAATPVLRRHVLAAMLRAEIEDAKQSGRNSPDADLISQEDAEWVREKMRATAAPGGLSASEGHKRGTRSALSDAHEGAAERARILRRSLAKARSSR